MVPEAGIGNNLVTLSNDLGKTESDEEDHLPANFPKNPAYMLRVVRHMDDKTMDQVIALAGREPRLAKSDEVFTSYMIGEDGKIGKYVSLPYEIKDDRPAVFMGSSTRTIVGEVTDSDRELMLAALETIARKVVKSTPTLSEPQQ